MKTEHINVENFPNGLRTSNHKWINDTKHASWISKKKNTSRMGLMAHTCNPSFLRGEDQEDPGSRPAQGET
jgi:hypothetical protein